MAKVLNRLINTMCHIVIDGQAHQIFYVVTHIIMLLQTIACIADPQSVLFTIVKWADPTTYLSPAFSIIISLLIISAFILLIVSKLIITESNQMLTRPNTFKIYMGNILLHLQILCKTTIMAPLIRATILQIQIPSSSGVMIASVFALTVYFILLLPLSLYNTSNTFILTSQINKKLTYINIYLLLNIFRLLFAILSPTSQPGLIITAVAFFLIFIFISIKQPVFAYGHERLLKGMISLVAFACLIRICQTIQNGAQQSILLQLVGMISFAFLIDWVSQLRIKTILSQQQPTVQQVKILIFLIANIKLYFQKLQYFMVSHHKICNNLGCQCQLGMKHMFEKGKTEGEYDVLPWYRFLISYIEGHYNLEQIKVLPETQIKLRIDKYQYLVVDLAEMYLFKLNKINQAYFTVHRFKNLLQQRQITSFSFRLKKKIFYYYLQESIISKYQTQGLINMNADSYMNFQVSFQKYRKTLLKTAKMTNVLWEEMRKRDPDGQKLTGLVHDLEEWNRKIRNIYNDIKDYNQSSKVLKEITNDYFYNILNIPEKSKFHIIQTPKFLIMDKFDQFFEKISQNMQAFSLDSETPMCFISVDQERFGLIVGSNSYFNKVMNLQFGKFVKIQEFMIPQMRQVHQKKMKSFIRGDSFSLQHKNGFTLNKKQKIVYTKILINIIPSISEGLRYAFFLKKLMMRTKLMGLKDRRTIEYTSQSFDVAFLNKDQRENLVKIIQQNIQFFQNNQQVKAQINEKFIQMRLLYQFNENDANWLFIEILQEDDRFLEIKQPFYGKSTDMSRRQSQQLYPSKHMKDSIISKDSKEEQNLQKSDLQQKLAADRIKKTQEETKKIYELIIDDTKKGFHKKIIIFTLIMVVLLIGAFLPLILIKINNQNNYLNTVKINQSFNTFLLTLTKAVFQIKYANFQQYIGNDSVVRPFFETASQNSNITTAMDNLVVHFNIQKITQSWNTFTCNSTNGQFILKKQNNLLSVSDFIQNPISNLLIANTSSFKFPPNLNGQSLPLNSYQNLYFTLMINSLYVTIPNFLQLKTSVMDSILQENVAINLSMILLLVTIILLSGIKIFGKTMFDLRVNQLKDQSYNLFESLSQELIIEKERKCCDFIAKYTVVDSFQGLQSLSSIRQDEFKSDDLNIVTCIRIDKTMEDRTQRQLNINTLPTQSKMECKNINKKAALVARVKSKNIFQKSSKIKVVIKYILLLLPLIIFASVFLGLEIHQTDEIENAIAIQSNIQVMQQNVNLVMLYAMQYGTEGDQFQQHLNIKLFLDDLISQMFEIQRSIVGNTYDFCSLGNVEQFLNEIAYSNLCTIESLEYPNNLMADCSAVNQNILTKGFYSSLVSYSSELNNLLIAYPDTSNLTTSQKITYLKNPYFTSHRKINLYFDAILANILKLFYSDFQSLVSSYTSILIYCTLGLLAGMGVIGFFIERFFLKISKQSILEIKSLFLLISFATITKDDTLKQKFQQKLSQFKKLK